MTIKYKVIVAKPALEEFDKAPRNQKEEAVNFIKTDLKTRPLSVGKPLGTRYIREKKIRKKRLYYCVYPQKVIVFVVASSDKKAQQKTINFIKNNYKKWAKQF